MNYDAFAETFSESRKNHPWPELDFIIEEMKQKEYTSVLDIGCWNGRFLEEAAKRGFSPSEYLWTDNSSGMIGEARKLHPSQRFEVIPMEEHREDIWKYDAILFLASFHHLENVEQRKEVLHTIQKLLKPHGRVYMTNWNLRDQVRYEKSHRGNGDFDIKIGEFTRYYHGFFLLELEALFQESGWHIEKNEIFQWGRNILSILSLHK
jgi:2-polyprenyl-3-methyl-5-hydroxy-6-metoxy-1,4-benzoquinol methylase